MNIALTPLPSHLGGILLLAFITAQSARLWRRRATLQHASIPDDLSRDDIVTVKMLSGEVYYGLFAGSDGRHLRLKNVHKVQTFADPAGHSQGQRLVSHRNADHPASDLTNIVLDKTVSIKRIGHGSKLAQLAKQDDEAAGAPHGSERLRLSDS